jgi:hypothetical protein
VHVRERDFRRGNEIEIPVAGDFEKILLELRQIAGALQRSAVGQERRLDFAVSVLARVNVEHEVDERARQPRAGSAQHRETRTRDLGTPLEVDDAERRPEVPMRLRREVEGWRLTHTPQFDVVRGAFSDRNAGVRQVRQVEHGCRPLIFDRVELNPLLLDFLRAGATGFLHRRGVLAHALGARDLVARRILQPLQPLTLRDEPAAGRLERGNLFEGFVGVEAAVGEAPANVFNVIANKRRIEHLCIPTTSTQQRATSNEPPVTSHQHCIFARRRIPLLRFRYAARCAQSRLSCICTRFPPWA